MKSVTARWSQGTLCVSAPLQLSTAEIMAAVNTMRTRILSRRPSETLKYFDGMVISCRGGITIIIRTSSENKRCIRCNLENNQLIISVSHLLDYNDIKTTNAISSMLVKVMNSLAARFLIQHAKTLASELKLHPRGFIIGHGKRKLGHCTTTGEISLSSNLMFLPLELVNYVIYHELAHLTQMNHSDKFHALCNSYCGGREKEYIRKIKEHKWCIIR